MSEPRFVYVIYIASTPEKVFAALADETASERYWFGNRAVSDWIVSSPWTLRRGDKQVSGGIVRAVDPPRQLSYTFHPTHEDYRGEQPSLVVFELEQQEDQVKLTVTHNGFEPGSKVFESISEGWPLMLSSFKSFVESGRVLRALWNEQAVRREQQEAVS